MHCFNGTNGAHRHKDWGWDGAVVGGNFTGTSGGAFGSLYQFKFHIEMQIDYKVSKNR